MNIFRKALLVGPLVLTTAGLGAAASSPAGAATVTIGGNANITLSPSWLICQGGTSGVVSWATPNVYGANLSQVVTAKPFLYAWNSSTAKWDFYWATRSDGSVRVLSLSLGSYWYDAKTGEQVTSLSTWSFPKRYVEAGYRVYWTDASGVARYQDVFDYVPTGMPNAGSIYCYTGG